jgi:hypothetical protein
MANWSKIKHRYPPNWAQLSHYIRFVRAQGRCENCGAVHGQRRLLTDKHGVVILACAHLDQNPAHNKHSNLRALCQECHLAHDRQDNSRRAAWTRFLTRWLRQPRLFRLDFEE